MKKTFVILSFFVFLIGCTSVNSGKESEKTAVIPQPVSVTEGSGEFTVTPGMKVYAAAEAEKAAEFLIEDFRLAGGFTLKRAANAEEAAICFVLSEETLPAEKGKEAYTLDVSADSVRIAAGDAAGFFYGYQTLKQLLPVEIYGGTVQAGVSWTVPAVSIEDWPRFKWRGMMLDSVRHFMPLPAVKRYIDLMAIHKFNTLHWHLTDDQGWRLEIKKYPLLTEVGSKRAQTLKGHFFNGVQEAHRFDGTPHGGYYTQEEAREIVRYAAERGITVVPEIEIPGHAQAAIAAYPWLGVRDIPDDVLIARKADSACFFNCEECHRGNDVRVSEIWGVSPNVFKPSEETMAFLKDVLTEVLAIFPSEYIHVGGDECPRDQWNLSPEVQQFIKDNNLGDGDGVQSWFLHRIDEFLTEKGRKLIGWDEILDGGLSPNAAVMSWRGKSGGVRAAKMGHDVVMSPTTYSYINYNQERAPYNMLSEGGYIPLNKVYQFDPVGIALAGKYEKYVLGGQANVWAEYLKSIEQVEYTAYPRAAAVAETIWTPKERKNYLSFTQRLSRHLQRLAILDVNFCVPSKGHKAATITASEDGEISIVIPESAGAKTVQIYLIPVDKSISAKIPQVKLTADGVISIKKRSECELFNGYSQAGVYTFHMKDPLLSDCEMTLTVEEMTAAGEIDIYVKYIDENGTCR